ncbi:hypothetical protein D3C76_644590 [compost metagenome]
MTNDAGHGTRRTAAAGDNAGKAEKPAPGQGRVASQLLVIQPEQGKDVLGESIAGTRLKTDVVAVLAPDAVQQAEQVVVEEVEERRPHTDTLRVFIRHLLQVIGGQGRIGAVQAHERGAHAIALRLPWQAFCLVHIRNREGQPWIAGKPHPQPGGCIWPTRLQVIAVQAVQPFQQLEEVVLVRLGEQLVG